MRCGMASIGAHKGLSETLKKQNVRDSYPNSPVIRCETGFIAMRFGADCAYESTEEYPKHRFRFDVMMPLVLLLCPLKQVCMLFVAKCQGACLNQHWLPLEDTNFHSVGSEVHRCTNPLAVWVS